MTYYFKHRDGSLTMCGERNQKVLSGNPDWTEIAEEEYNAILNSPQTAEEIEAAHLDELRIKREPLLKAYDILRINYLTDELDISSERMLELKSWFGSIKDLNEDAINNIPSEIQYYL